MPRKTWILFSVWPARRPLRMRAMGLLAWCVAGFAQLAVAWVARPAPREIKVPWRRNSRRCGLVGWVMVAISGYVEPKWDLGVRGAGCGGAAFPPLPSPSPARGE